MELLAQPFDPIPGMNETLVILRKKRILLAIVSGRDIQELTVSAAEVKIDLGLFNLIQAADTYQFRKPDLRAFGPALQIFSEQGIAAAKVAVVGDTVAFDLEAARTHEPPLKFIGIVSSASGQQEFLEAGVPEKLILRPAAAIPNILPYFR